MAFSIFHIVILFKVIFFHIYQELYHCMYPFFMKILDQVFYIFLKENIFSIFIFHKMVSIDYIFSDLLDYDF